MTISFAEFCKRGEQARKKIPASRRKEIAQKAAKARWDKIKPPQVTESK